MISSETAAFLNINFTFVPNNVRELCPVGAARARLKEKKQPVLILLIVTVMSHALLAATPTEVGAKSKRSVEQQ